MDLRSGNSIVFFFLLARVRVRGSNVRLKKKIKKTEKKDTKSAKRNLFRFSVATAARAAVAYLYATLPQYEFGVFGGKQHVLHDDC